MGGVYVSEFMGASQILGNRDKPGGIRGDTPRAPLCLPKFWDAPHKLGCVDILPNMSRLREERSDEESPGGRSKQAKQGGDSSLVPHSE